MTALIVLEHVDDLQSYAVVPSIPLPQTVGVGLLPGESITIEQALRALIVKSANDAALTLATYIAGDEPSFVRLMNARARQLGLRSTHFENCRGTPRPGHLSTARDLAALGRFAMLDPRFRELAGTRSAVITWPPDHAVKVTSHNRLLQVPVGRRREDRARRRSRAWCWSAPAVRVWCLSSWSPCTSRIVTRRSATPSPCSCGARRSTRARPSSQPATLVTTVRLAGGGRVALAAATPLTAVVRTAAPVKVRRAVPRRLAQLPPAGTVIGRAGYWVDGVRLGTVDLVAAGLASATPRPSGSASAAP